MGTTSPDLLLAVDRGRGIRAQIEDGIRSAVRGGTLAPGSALPSTRALAADLGVTRRVVVEAYEQLGVEGYLVARHGAGTVVDPALRLGGSPPPPGTSAPDTPPPDVDFRPGSPDPALFPRAAWARATRNAVAAAGPAELSDADDRGLPALRAELARYLARVRGVVADPDRIVVCAGFGQAFDLLVRVLPDARFALEDPGYRTPRRRLERTGVPYDAVPVDGEGLVVDALRAGRATAAVVTPAHQNPTGVALSPTRRSELVAWARETGGLVVEDDFDAEFRYDRRPVGALQGLAPDRVAYCGTTAKTLASGLRLGWAVLPPDLVDDVRALRAVTDRTTSTLLQSTFAHLLRAGDLDRHLRRARRTYRRRRDAVVGAVAEHLPEARVSGIAAGLTVVLELPAGCDEAAVVAGARERGVGVYPLGPFRVRAAGRPGLVLGYGAVTSEQAAAGIERLAPAVARHRRPGPRRTARGPGAGSDARSTR